MVSRTALSLPTAPAPFRINPSIPDAALTAALSYPNNSSLPNIDIPAASSRTAIKPKIPDADNDKTFTGIDIFEKLKQERPLAELGFEKPETLIENLKDLSAHNLMRSIDANGLARSLARTIRETNACSTGTLTEIADTINTRLTKYRTLHGEPVSLDHHKALRSSAETAVLELAKEKGWGPLDTQSILHQKLAEIDFAHSLSGTFEQGIAIKAEEVPAILELFGNPEVLKLCRK